MAQLSTGSGPGVPSQQMMDKRVKFATDHLPSGVTKFLVIYDLTIEKILFLNKLPHTVRNIIHLANKLSHLPII